MKEFTWQCLRCERRFCRQVDCDLHLATDHYLDMLVPSHEWLFCATASRAQHDDEKSKQVKAKAVNRNYACLFRDCRGLE